MTSGVTHLDFGENPIGEFDIELNIKIKEHEKDVQYLFEKIDETVAREVSFGGFVFVFVVGFIVILFCMAILYFYVPQAYLEILGGSLVPFVILGAACYFCFVKTAQKKARRDDSEIAEAYK